MVNAEINRIGIIPHSRPFLGEEEASRAAEVIKTGMVAQGEQVEAFESEFCRKFGFMYAAAVSSGTAALHLSLLALGIGPGHEVIIPSFVCTALMHAVRYTGAEPVAADVDPDTYNIDPIDVKTRITAKSQAIVVPHMFGLSADMDRLLALGVPIIEDCAQGVGGTYNGKPLGNYGKAAIFSFYATKVMTTGEGGMVASSSKDLINRIKDLREYDKKDDGNLRYNYKMTDIQAAIGLTQLERLDFFITRRREIARQYSVAFKGLELQLPVARSGHIYFRYIIKPGINVSVDEWINRLKNLGVQCERPIFKPIHQYLGLTGYPQTEQLYHRLVSIPIYPSLTAGEIKKVISSITDLICGRI